jgi:lipid A ethanolaminephosphotransferase
MIPVKCLVFVTNKDATPPVKPSAVNIGNAGSPLNKVVFIMDESIRGDYTTLGNPAIDTTPYLAGLGEILTNFGVALSGHNCSGYSRYILRYGARAEDLPRALQNGLNLPGPNIWQFAKSAGLRTVYIDGFSSQLRLHSGMSLRETTLIDEYVRIPAALPHDRDVIVSECLRRALADPAPAFIYVDKYGIHVPYDDKFPPGHAVFKAPPNASYTEKFVTTYKNAVRWNVDEFFRRVLTGLDLSQVAIFYTSDHGQSLLEGDYSASHCSVGANIVKGEAFVPLFSIVGNEALRNELTEASKKMLNKASHFEIFPTLLATFGFDRAAVRAIYGAGLFGEPSKQRRFLSGFKTSAVWVEA